jgi:hypothetical protein
MKIEIPDGLKIPYRPWAFFFLFFSVNFILSSDVISLSFRLEAVLLGLILLLAAGFVRYRDVPSGTHGFGDTEISLPLISWPVLFILGIFSLFIRFWHLGCSDWWARGDEAITGLGAIALKRHWNWDAFEYFGQIPTTLSRICYLLIRLTHDPLFSLQFSTASLSAIAVFFGYKACRQFFSASFSRGMALLLMFDFFSLWTARTGYSASLYLLWEWMVFYLLGKLLTAPGPWKDKKAAFLLGLAGGLGPLMLTPWPMVVLFLILLLGLIAWHFPNRYRTPWMLFMGSLFLTLAPFLYLVFTGQYGQHISKISVWNHFSWKNQFWVLTEYISDLFWRYPHGFDSTPCDRFLNPILGSCFWLGVLEIPRMGRKGWALGLAVPFFLLPGFLSTSFEPLRILSVVPFLLLLSALGLQTLIHDLRPPRRVPLLVILLLASSLVDIGRLYASHGEGEGQLAFESLRPFISNQKSGYLFLLPVSADPSYPNLAYSTYCSNAAWNPDLPLGNIQWAAVFTDAHYLPSLAQRFSGSQWMTLPSMESGGRIHNILGLIPVTAENKELFRSWRDFYELLQDINWEETNLVNGKSREKVLRDLLVLYPRIPQDPFLQSCFLEKLTYQFSWENTFYPEDTWTNWKNFSGVFQESFNQSYQDAELCEKYGHLLAVEGDDAGAKKIFQKAMKLSPGNPWLKDEMKQLGLGS